MFELMFEFPYKDVSFKMSLLNSVPKGKRPTIPDKFLNDKFYDGYIKLMKNCWNGNTNLRPDFNEIIYQLENLLK
jgi:hypothetical protein